MLLRFAGLAILLTLPAFACGPVGSEAQAPALLAVSTTALSFGAESSARVVEIANEGGADLAFTVTVSAAVDGITWLTGEPLAGSLSGGSSRSVVLTTTSVAQLPPGVFKGSVTVESEGQESKVVEVTLEVGQPILALEPADSLEFGATAETRNLVVKNSGKGRLKSSLHLPGAWISQEPALIPDLGSGESQTVTLTVDRAIVPWYGAGEETLLVASNGLDSGDGTGNALLGVWVTVDATCINDQDCTREGYFCQVNGDSGECAPRKANGAKCTSGGECGSGYCAAGTCCESSCEGQCRSCAEPGQAGKCVGTSGAECEDGLVCTAGDVCAEGECVGGGEPDCTGLDNACQIAICDEDAGGCVAVAPDNQCLIDDSCVAAGAKHPDHGCLVCRPEEDAADWSVALESCWVGGECYEDGVAIGGPCRVCDANHPIMISDAPDNTSCGTDEDPCVEGTCQAGECEAKPVDDKFCDDGNPCTKMDKCAAGECAGTAFVCDDGLACTVDSCDGDGGCGTELKEDYCLIDGKCVAGGEYQPGQEGCGQCAPEKSTDDWTPATDETPCDDDGLDCTSDLCQTGTCDHALLPGNCLIDGKCRKTGATNPLNDCLACVPEQDVGEWSPHNDGMPCDDGLWCSVDDVCDAGNCTGADRDCGGDDCNSDWCLEDKEECVKAPKANGQPCDDGDACTVGEICGAGLCTGAPKDCSGIFADNPCFDGECISDDPVEPGKCVPVQREAGAVCDDGLACTVETTCDTQGGCKGDPLTDDDCTGLLGLVEFCLSGVCKEPEGCVSEPLDNGTPCPLQNAVAQCEDGQCTFIKCEEEVYADCNDDPADGCEAHLFEDLQNCGECGSKCILDHAWTKCEAGQCVLVACKDGFTDCDEELANGCESKTATDPANCGLCGTVCGSPNPAKTGICEDGECQLEACGPEQWNLDGDPTNGCECTEGGQELCNGTDDDCDGEVDEGFDLLYDLSNCGGCGQICQVDGVEAFDCLSGNCLVTRCPEGWVDRNGESADGCEFELFAVNELWVDSINGGLPGADGSQGKPFATIDAALAVTQPSTRIHLLPGAYQGGQTLDVVGTVLVGAGADKVTVSAAQGQAGFLITANEVVIRDLKVANGSVGVRFEGHPLAPIETAVLSDVIITGQTGLGEGQVEEDLRAVGVEARYVNSLSVLSTRVSQITGGSSVYPTNLPNGGEAAGLFVRWCEDVVVSASTFETITSGDAAAGWQTGGFDGGDASGIRLESSTGARLVGNRIEGVAGGLGASTNNFASIGTGGLAAGIRMVESTGNLLSGNRMDEIDGGPGGGAFGGEQVGFGLYLDEASLANDVRLDNTAGGEPVVMLHQVSGVVLKGLTLTGPVNPTNWGVVVVVDSTDVTISDCVIGNYVGATGRACENGADGAGVRLVGCTGCAFIDNQVSNIQGGTGAHCGTYATWGGRGVGLLVDDCPGATVRGNHIASISGGQGADSFYPVAYGNPGEAAGVVLSDSAGLTFSNNSVVDVRRSIGALGYLVLVSCVEAGGESPLVLRNLSCYGIGKGEYLEQGSGVVLIPGTLAQVQVLDSIIASTSGYCLSGLAGNEALLNASYTDLWDCEDGTSVHAVEATGCFSADPLFVNAQDGYLQLEEGSPCIDAGNPLADCSQEVAPNGCAVNLGSFGNTSDATSAPDAGHCNVCP
jgi:hypothetical protein